jgi:hypothetical protein
LEFLNPLAADRCCPGPGDIIPAVGREPLLLLELDSLPGRVPEYHIEAAAPARQPVC